MRGIQRAVLAVWTRLRRPSRRSAPTLIGLEKGALLSGRILDNAVVSSAHHPTISENRAPVSKVNKQIAFVTGLYRTYFHRTPQPAELSYALEQLDSGLSQAALKREFVNATSKSSKTVSSVAFVNGLYATLGARPATPAGQAYWLGLVDSGVSRSAVANRFQATNGMLPAPTITWPTPGPIVYGTVLGVAQLNAQASVAGTFTYSPPTGTIPYALPDQPLSVTFTPTDSADYAPVTASVNINVYPATPTITWLRPHAIMYGTPLSDVQLNPTATWIVGGKPVPVPGTFTYSSPPGTVLPVGTNLSLTAVFRPFDSSDFSTVVATTNITVTFGPPPPTPTPPPTPAPSPPSPTPSPTPYPTPAPFPTPFPGSPFSNSSQRVAPPPTPPPTPFDLHLPATAQTLGATYTIPNFLVTEEEPAPDALTPPPTTDSLSVDRLAHESSRAAHVPITDSGNAITARTAPSSSPA